ncbi:MAG: glycoside hydrolase family 29 (alpha-L-fucosidase) [Acidobacteriaceae bacterium]|nr:glycoside hydrolase family 29 (alpha-L-fucosidase) [Acidobacteriaceae bacterium]
MCATRLSRRDLLKTALSAAPALALNQNLFAAQGRKIAPGPFQPTWQSLKSYQTPEWFRDAKFGIWNHWTAQCVPEQGDWYARRMYLQGDKCYDHQLKTYGHPSKSGFMEIDNLWKADRWQPEQLMDLYVAAGAKYFAALANHHDNFDNYNSRYHNWNSVKVGPKKDIVGTLAKLVKDRGLRLAVTNHSGHAWHWLQSAYGYDPEGSLAGVRYDAYTLKKSDGKGKWWEGLDPQELYTGRNIVMPDGIKSIAEADAWHKTHDRVWNESVPVMNPAFAENWYLRCQDLLDTYKPDMIYFDDDELPLGQYGLDITAHFYNTSVRDKGHVDVVVTGKSVKPDHAGAFTLDIERGKAQGILDYPWQTDTCIGDWHYDRSVFDRHAYKTPRSVIHSLIDIVSKNGNLMLNIPLRGDGTIDEDEHAFLKSIAGWMQINGPAIYGTRPFTVFGEGPPDVSDNKNFNEAHQRPYTAEDIRFVTKGDTLHAFALGWPANGKVVIKTLARNSPNAPKPIQRVDLLGAGQLTFTQDASGLKINLPSKPPNEYAYAFVLRT